MVYTPKDDVDNKKGFGHFRQRFGLFGHVCKLAAKSMAGRRMEIEAIKTIEGLEISGLLETCFEK